MKLPTSTSEQLVLCTRYVILDKVQKDLLKLVNVENTSGLNLSKIILHQLDELGLNIKYLRGKVYDGVANMSGKYQGVQSQILKIQHLALYTHCASHCLNLSISKACSVVMIRKVVGNIQEIITFFRTSPKRMLLLKTTLMKFYQILNNLDLNLYVKHSGSNDTMQFFNFLNYTMLL